VSIDFLRLEKMNKQIEVDKTWTKTGWIMAGSSLIVAALTLYLISIYLLIFLLAITKEINLHLCIDY